MIAATSSVTSTPSQEEIAQQLGVDLAFEPELIHIVSKMRTTPLPPTWTVVDTSVGHQNTRNPPDASNNTPVISTAIQGTEYFNYVTKESTRRHPGTAYFLAAVESERESTTRRDRDDGMTTFGPTQPSTIGNVGFADESSSPPVPQQRQKSENDHADAGGKDPASQGIPGETLTANDQREAWDAAENRPSEVKVVYKEARDVAGPEVASTPAMGNGADAGPNSKKRASTGRGKDGKRRIPAPKWLVFTSWWNETISGTESTLSRKHASIRYATGNSSFEVELEDVPAIFEVSHATGRYGKVGTIDIRVGAQISILGRQMTLMQCDGPTAQWLESEVRAITKAKTALVAALEKEEGDYVRVTCRSDRLVTSASAQRGSGSVGQAAEMDRRALTQDVLTLRDILAQSQPSEALKLTEGLISV